MHLRACYVAKADRHDDTCTAPLNSHVGNKTMGIYRTVLRQYLIHVSGIGCLPALPLSDSAQWAPSPASKAEMVHVLGKTAS